MRGPTAPTSMSESHLFLWKATKTKRPPRPAFTGRAAGAPGPTENCVCCSPLPPPRAAARNTELLNILNHFRFNRCLTGEAVCFLFFFFFWNFSTGSLRLLVTISCVTVNPSLHGTRWGWSWGPSSCAAAEEDFPSASLEPLHCVVNSLPCEVSPNKLALPVATSLPL